MSFGEIFLNALEDGEKKLSLWDCKTKTYPEKREVK
jgi:hypothetical protein